MTGRDQGKTAISRRLFLGGATAAAAILPVSSAFAAQAPVVTTRYGKLRGMSDGGVLSFRGIPYAAPTSGQLRFRAPAPPAAWRGIRNATAYGPMAPQLPDPGHDDAKRLASASEDSLVLNVWTASADPSAKRPVMVWIHGGGLSVGSGSDPVTDGTHLAGTHDVVVVTLNHRLNIFGYLYFGNLVDEGQAVANPGQLDIVAALEWVRDNIAEFGGDPGNVTIFGHSGGGSKVGALLAMPSARGLFHRAILQSGFSTAAQTPEQGEEIARDFFKAMDLPAGDIAGLRALPPGQLLAGLRRLTNGSPILGPGMVADGQILPQVPLGRDSPQVSPDIPILVGHAAQETTVLFPPSEAFTVDWAGLPALVGSKLAALPAPIREPEPLITGFRRLMPDATPSEIFFAITTEDGMGQNARIVAEKRAKLPNVPVFAYVAAWQSPAQGGKLRAHHGVEVPMVFDNSALRHPPGSPRAEEAKELGRIMSGYWTQFARTGDPNKPGLPDWPAYRIPGRATMIFDSPATVRNDPLGAEQALIAFYA